MIIIEILNSQYKKRGFDCGNDLLNNYIRRQAKQDVSRDLSACYILNNSDDKKIIGYYTLSGNSINRNDFPEDLIMKLPPSYVNLSTVLLGRLAVDNTYKGKGFGETLLIDALKRCVDISKNLGVIAVIVDPIDQKAVTFYESYGFILIPSTNKMFIPIKTIENSL